MYVSQGCFYGSGDTLPLFLLYYTLAIRQTLPSFPSLFPSPAVRRMIKKGLGTRLAERYGNHIACLCICSQISGKTMNIGGSNELLADFKLYKHQNKQQAFAKTFRLQSYDNLYHSWCHKNLGPSPPVLVKLGPTSSK